MQLRVAVRIVNFAEVALDWRSLTLAMAAHVVVGTLLFLLALVSDEIGAQQPTLPDQQNSNPPSSWEIEGEYETIFDYRKNFALDRSNRDDLFRFDQEFELRWSYRHRDWIAVLIEGKVLGEHELYTGGGARRSEVDLERGETWVRFDRLFGDDLTLKVGRQNFEEPRRWWWDDDLDAVSLRYRGGAAFLQIGVGQELPRKSLLEDFSEPENEGVFRLLARANWRYVKNHGLDLFLMHHQDRSSTPSVGASLREDRVDPSDARLWWAGVRASGRTPREALGDLSYWADGAAVFGREKLLEFEEAPGNREVVTSRRSQPVQGWAIDIGARWDSQFPGQPLFTLGYALGSGDKTPERGIDHSFRQTGLQSNDEEFRTYGELLRPELSNLSVPVFAVQFPVLSRSYVEFAYRHFRQIHAVPFVRDSRIEAEPNGTDKNIGQEWMLYGLLKEWKNVEIELVGAAFRAGNAYGMLSGKMAYSLFTKITFEF